jgi:hypothetical protein
MKLVMRKRALNSLAKVADWIDDKNTIGAGNRLVTDTYKELDHLASIKVKQAICKDPKLAKFEYRCFTHKDRWIVAYKILKDEFVVYRFIYGPWLDY